MTALPRRSFQITALGPNVDPAIRDAFQAVAQALDQLITGIYQITPAAGIGDVTNNGPAGNFNGVFLIGTIAAANTRTIFSHQLNRTPVGAFELMALPQANQSTAPVAQVASAIALLAASNNQVTLTSTAAHRQFTLILM